MATTIKNFISIDSPQYDGHIAPIKFQILQNFSKYMTYYNILLQTIFQTTQLFLTLSVTVPNTINTYEFRLNIIPGLKFKIPSQYFAITYRLF